MTQTITTLPRGFHWGAVHCGIKRSSQHKEL